MAAILITNSILVNPSPPLMPPSLNTFVPLTIFDFAGIDRHFVFLCAFHAPTPSNDDLKESLSKALSYFPILSSRLSTNDLGRPCIFLNGAGARLVEASISTPLAEKLPLETSTDLHMFYPSLNHGAEELLQVQLTRFSCGGLVIGVTVNHRVSDGRSLSNFVSTWAAISKGTHDGIASSSYFDRAQLFAPRDPPIVEFDHRGIEFDPSYTRPAQEWTPKLVENVVLHFSLEFIAMLKNSVPGKCSTFDCISAHLWKKIITSIRGVNEDEISEVRIGVGGRGRMKPAIPIEYFGNMVVRAHPMLTAGELLHASLVDIVKVIHDAVSRVDDHYIRSFIDFGKVMEGKEEDLMPCGPKLSSSSTCPNLTVSSWLGFEFHELDFGTGSGRPLTCITPNLVLEGLVMLVPSCQEKGGVVAYIALAPDHAEEFKKSCYSFDY